MAALPPSAPRVMFICLAVLLVATADVAPAGAAAQEAPARSLKGFSSSSGGRGSSIRSSSLGGYSSSSSTGDGGSHGSGYVVWVVIGCLAIFVLLPLAGFLAHSIFFADAAEASGARPKDAPQVAQQVALVSLDRSDGAALGVDISEKQDHLLITRICEEGLASEWNKAHPDAQLRVDDKIVAVNGACGSSDALLAQCKRHAALRISVVPAGAALPPESLGWRDACVGIGNNGYGV